MPSESAGWIAGRATESTSRTSSTRGDSVVACLHLRGTGKGSGLEVDRRFYMHWKLREGKMVYLYEYADRNEALEGRRAVGVAALD